MSGNFCIFPKKIPFFSQNGRINRPFGEKPKFSRNIPMIFPSVAAGLA